MDKTEFFSKVVHASEVVISYSDSSVVAEMTHVQAPTVSVGSIPASVRLARLPRWCSLPVPGTSLVVSDTSSMHETFIPIDQRRVYSIGGSSGDDIVYSDLIGLRLLLMHHRSGAVYITVRDPSPSTVTARIDGHKMITLNSDPFELALDVTLEVRGVKFAVTKRAGSKQLRDCLRDFCTDDAQTHTNTVRNMSAKNHSQNKDPNSCSPATPTSVKRKKKRRKANDVGDVARSVKFADV